MTPSIEGTADNQGAAQEGTATNRDDRAAGEGAATNWDAADGCDTANAAMQAVVSSPLRNDVVLQGNLLFVTSRMSAATTSLIGQVAPELEERNIIQSVQLHTSANRQATSVLNGFMKEDLKESERLVNNEQQHIRELQAGATPHVHRVLENEFVVLENRKKALRRKYKEQFRIYRDNLLQQVTAIVQLPPWCASYVRDIRTAAMCVTILALYARDAHLAVVGVIMFVVVAVANYMEIGMMEG